MGDEQAAPISGSYWVHAHRLLAGPYPTPETLKDLIQAGVEFFIDLTEPDECSPYKPLLPDGMWYRQYPIPYQGVPTHEYMRRILNAIDAGIVDRRVVYVHSQAGRGRTCMVAGCHMVRYGLSGREALKLIARLHNGEADVLDTDPQRWLVEQWCERDRR